MDNKKTVAISSDHAGFELKEILRSFLEDLNYNVIDHGAYKLDKDDDYPDFMAPLARDVSKHSDILKGIVIGASGQGEAIACNKFPGVRAVVYYGGNAEIIQLSREHNDANILSLGAQFLNIEEAKMVVKTWLETPFSGDERHVRRIKKLDKLDIL
jgi:ribose 5-phosphate isomerase B